VGLSRGEDGTRGPCRATPRTEESLGGQEDD
jgi:hypothetical protein